MSRVPHAVEDASADALDGTAPRALVLVGHPVAHSLSPRFQQAALDAAGLGVHYVARDVEPAALAAFLRTARAEGVAGNVTIPHKEAVAVACDRLTAIARRAGAVNTFGIDAAGRLVGHNTDVAGATRAIRAVGDVANTHVVVLGAGGSAAAVLLALEALGAARITLSARSPERARALVTRIAPAMPVRVCAHDALAPDELADASLVVNSTPLGLRDGDPFPVAPDALAPAGAALDLVYRAGETAWVRAVRASGRRAEDGLRMLVEQGAAAFAWWFGVAPDRQAMWSVLEPRGTVPA